MALNAGVYFSFGLVTSLINFFVVPLLSHFLSVEDIGTIGMFNVVNQFFVPVMGLSMNSIITRSYYSRNDIDQMIGSSQIFSLLIFCGVFLFVTTIPASWITSLGLTRSLMIVVTMVSFASINSAVCLAVLQLEKMAVNWGIVSLISISLNLAVTFAYLFLIEADYWSRVMGIFISSVCSFSLSFFFVRRMKNISYSFSLQHFRYFMQLGIPLIVYALCGWALTAVDRVLIKNIMGMQAVGIFVMASTLAMPMQLVVVSFLRAWTPHAYVRLNEHKYWLLLRESGYVFGGFAVAAVALVTVGRGLFRVIIAEEFEQSFVVMPVLVIGFTAGCIYRLLIPYLLHFERTGMQSFIMFFAMLLNIAGNWFLIPRFGLMGAAYATFFSYFLMSLLCMVNVYYLIESQKNV